MAVSEWPVYTSRTLLTRDTRSGSYLWGVNNLVTDSAEARRVINDWGMQIRAHPDRIHQME